MRIIGGRARGLHLAPVGIGDQAAHLRPTSDRVRGAIFNLLINGGYGDPLTGARVLDLFSGTGALGLEALSRGAAKAVFVDNGDVARRLLTRNIALLRAEADCDIIHRDATRLGPWRGPGFEVVFLDPPYGKGLGEQALAGVLAGGWLASDGLLVWEDSASPLLPVGVEKLDQRKYGDTVVTILRATV